MKQLIAYKEALKEIYDYFGFVEDWSVFPLEDATAYWWFIERGCVFYFDSLEAYEQRDESHTYVVEILHHRFYPNAIYEGKDNKYTMIIVDTNTDGNKFLQIFDNSKKVEPIKD